MPDAAKVLILTPVRDRQDLLETYFANLDRISYPHRLISLGFLEGDSSDSSYEDLRRRLPSLERQFAQVGLWKRDFNFHPPSGVAKWAGSIQRQRRGVLARCRNYLLSKALADEDWVLWLDVDVASTQPDALGP